MSAAGLAMPATVATRATPWRAIRTGIDVLVLATAAAPVLVLDPAKAPTDQLKAGVSLLALVVLPAIVAGGKGHEADAGDPSDAERIVERLSPLCLVPSLIGLLFFPTFAAWGALELCLMVCCPLAFFLNLPRVRSLFLLHCGLAAGGSAVLTAQAAFFLPLFGLLLFLALAVDRFESVHDELPPGVPSRAGVALGVGAGAFLLVAYPAYHLSMLLLPPWRRDLSGSGPPALANAGEPPPPFVQEISLAVGLLMLIWMIRQLIDGGGAETAAVKTTDDEEVEDLLPPDIVAIEDEARRPKRARKEWPDGRRAVIDAWLRVEQALGRRGWIRGAGQPPRSFALAVADAIDAPAAGEGRAALLALAAAFDRARYGRDDPGPEEVAAVRAQADRARRAAKTVRAERAR